MFENFKPTPKTIENLSELANKVYDDGLKKTVQETGEIVALIPRAIKAALEPVERLILYREHSIAATEKMLEEKLINEDPEEIVSPEPYVAVPAINAVACCYDSDELRNLYANLIARSMLKNEKHSVHPAFVEIIKQLSPTDASILRTLYEESLLAVPLVTVNAGNTDSYISVIKNVCNIPPYAFRTTAMSIENLNRLKLIDILPGVHFSHDTKTDEFIKSPEFNKFLNTSVLLGPENKLLFIKSVTQPTEFGLAFCNTCVKDL